MVQQQKIQALMKPMVVLFLRLHLQRLHHLHLPLQSLQEQRRQLHHLPTVSQLPSRQRYIPTLHNLIINPSQSIQQYTDFFVEVPFFDAQIHFHDVRMSPFCNPLLHPLTILIPRLPPPYHPYHQKIINMPHFELRTL